MTKFFIRILKFSGPYRNRVLSAAVFAFIKGVCVMMPLFLGFLMFSSFYDGTITIRSCWNYLLAMVVTVLLNIAATRLSDQMQSTAGYKSGRKAAQASHGVLYGWQYRTNKFCPQL